MQWSKLKTPSALESMSAKSPRTSPHKFQPADPREMFGHDYSL